MPDPIELTASTATADAPAPTVDPNARTITGTIAVWDVPGVASVGPCIFTRGSIQLPTELQHVKLLIDHDKGRPVGYLRDASVTAAGIDGTFYVPPGEAGDLALAYARDGLRDALSPGAYVTGYDRDSAGRLVVSAAMMHETSLVAVPAFAGARVRTVTAQRKEMEVPEHDDTAPETEAPPTPTPTPTVVTAAAPDSSQPDADARAARDTAAAVSQAPTTTRPRVSGFGLTAMAQLVHEHLAAHRPAAQLPVVIEAALNDVTPANISTTDYGPRRPQYVDDLWTEATVTRPVIDAFGPTRPLKSLKLWGWVWETRPAVARYTGNKADVPSNQPKRVRQDVTAQRFAGGWDIDRAFVDLPNDTDEIRDILIEATRSYAEQSEAYVAETIAAAATDLTGAAASVPAALARIGSHFGGIKGSRISYVGMGTGAWDAFVNMTSDGAPWWLRNLGSLSLTENSGEAAGVRFAVDPNLAPTTILAGDRRAARVWEVDPPVKVQALDIPRGGIDVGVFGYVAALVTDPRLVVSVDTAGTGG